MSKALYCQCKVRKNTDSGTLSRVFWTDLTRAVTGKEVKVQDDDGSWSDGWTVDEVYNQVVDEATLNKMRHAHTKQRAASDI